MDVEVGQVYERDGQRFRVVDTDLRTKGPSDANWSPGVAYESLDDDEPKSVRTVRDFLAKFTLTDEA